MKKVWIGIIMSVLTLALLLTGCSKKVTSNSTLNIADNLDYSEESARQEMARVKVVEFAKDGASNYKILVNVDASEDLEYDAEFLQLALRKVTGATTAFGIVHSATSGDKYITLGGDNMDLSGVTDDGFAIDIQAGGITIGALSENGISNGIYRFLEDYIGCMFTREDFSYYPSFGTIYLDAGTKVDNPDFEWRKIFSYESVQNRWFRRIQTNGVTDKDGATVEKNVGWGTWCHNVYTFVPPKEYFASNPEYYALVDGERRIEYNGQDSQLCLTNPDIYAIIEDKMSELMAASPENTYWDFSINDNRNHCQCDNCMRVMAETGSMMGTMLPIINKLAVKFPDKMISTLAYFYNETPPKGIVLEDNVNIVIAPIATGQLYSYKYGNDAASLRAKELIESWTPITKNILIWDYVINFSNLLLPYPNFDVQKENLEFYKEHNVTSVFHQASREKGDELANLRTYVLARQLWDINVDIDKLMGKYLVVTYGKAAPFVAEYLDTMNKNLKDKAKNLDLYDSPAAHAIDYLSTMAIEDYGRIIDEAMQAVEGDESITYRLEEIKINVLYAKMNESSVDFAGKKKAFEEFTKLVNKHEIVKVSEWQDMQEYIDKTYPQQLKDAKGALIATCTAVPIAVILLGLAASLLAVKVKQRREEKRKKEKALIDSEKE